MLDEIDLILYREKVRHMKLTNKYYYLLKYQRDVHILRDLPKTFEKK